MSAILEESVDFGDAADFHLGANHESGFCDGSNIADCIQYINQELTVLGLSHIECDIAIPTHTSHRHLMTAVLNSWHELLCLHRRDLRIREDSEDSYHRLKSDYGSMQLLNNRLSRDIEQRKHSYAIIKDKLQQSEHKNKSLSLKLKANKEEMKRLQSVMQSRDNLQKHTLKKRETEMLKLKERLNRILSDKPRMPLIEISKPVRKCDGKRGTWKVGSTRPEEEWHRFVISTYEDQHHSLILENREMRDMLERMHDQLDLLTNNNTLPEMSESDSDRESAVGDVLMCIDVFEQMSESDSDRESVVGDVTAGHFQMPFELVRKDLDRKFTRTCKYLQAILHGKQSGSRPQSPYVSSLSPSPTAVADTSDMDEMTKRLHLIKQLVHEQERVISKKQQSLERSELCPVQPNRTHNYVPYTQNQDGLKVIHSTPTFSPNPKPSVKTPSTEELYRWMGLTSMDQRENSTPTSQAQTPVSGNYNHNSLPHRRLLSYSDEGTRTRRSNLFKSHSNDGGSHSNDRDNRDTQSPSNTLSPTASIHSIRSLHICNTSPDDSTQSPANSIRDSMRSATNSIRDSTRSPTNSIRDSTRSPANSVRDSTRSATNSIRSTPVQSPSTFPHPVHPVSPSNLIQTSIRSPSNFVESSVGVRLSPANSVRGITSNRSMQAIAEDLDTIRQSLSHMITASDD